MADGFAINEEIVGGNCATVAVHVVVATVDDASATWSVIEYVPGRRAIVCEVDVPPLPQRNAIGATPPVEDAVHVMLVVEGAPAQKLVNAGAAVATANDSINAVLVIKAITPFNAVFMFPLRSVITLNSARGRSRRLLDQRGRCRA